MSVCVFSVRLFFRQLRLHRLVGGRKIVQNDSSDSGGILHSVKCLSDIILFLYVSYTRAIETVALSIH